MSDPVPPPQSQVNIALLVIGLLVFVPGGFCAVSMLGSMVSSTDLDSELDPLLFLLFGVPSIGLTVFGAWLIHAALPRRPK